MTLPSPREIDTAVFDTSPLVFLDALGYVPLLPKLFNRMLIPPAVAEELLALPGEAGSTVPQLLEQQAPNPETLKRVRSELAADPGEEEAITLALDLGSWVVMDERPGRSYAETLGMKLTGTLGIILRLHRLGLALRSPGAELELLDKRGMRLSPALRKAILGQE
jgi:uncharacterized protein